MILLGKSEHFSFSGMGTVSHKENNRLGMIDQRGGCMNIGLVRRNFAGRAQRGQTER